MGEPNLTLTEEERQLIIDFTNDIGSFGLKWCFVQKVVPRGMMIRFIKFMRDCQVLK